MSTDLPQTPLTPEELAFRQAKVRKIILLRGLFLGLIIAAWWIFFAPESIVGGEYKNILGVLVGLVASGSYFFNLRQNIFPPKQG
jgi:hypothetical protein